MYFCQASSGRGSYLIGKHLKTIVFCIVNQAVTLSNFNSKKVRRHADLIVFNVAVNRKISLVVTSRHKHTLSKKRYLKRKENIDKS